MSRMGMRVYFNDGSVKDFTGFWRNVILEIASYCEANNLETANFDWIH